MKPFDVDWGVGDERDVQLSDAEVDRLLVDFFRGETPACLPAPPAPPSRRHIVPIRWQHFGLAAAAAAIGWVAAAPLPVRVAPPTPAVDVVHTPPLVEPATPRNADTQFAAARSPETVMTMAQTAHSIDAEPIEASVASGRRPIERRVYATELGNVEQRTILSWTTYTIQSSRTGALVEYTVPRFTIEVVRLPEAPSAHPPGE